MSITIEISSRKTHFMIFNMTRTETIPENQLTMISYLLEIFESVVLR